LLIADRYEMLATASVALALRNGDGTASEKIVKILANVSIGAELLVKRMKRQNKTAEN